MKARMYWSYATRSLARGGQRTLLAIFCVAVGVLAIVALQLVGNMVNNALTSNIREGNGGDVAVSSPVSPLTPTQMDIFAQLRSQGQITQYTAVSRHKVQSITRDGSQYFSLRAVDPNNFPLVGTPFFETPSNGTFPSILTGDAVVITKDLATTLNAHVGDTVKVTSDDGRTVNATIGGIIQNAGFFQSPQMLMAIDAYRAVPSTSGLPVSFSSVYINVPDGTDANAAVVEKRIQDEIPVANVTTTKEALQGNADRVQSIRYFLQVVGLLALLIGGGGIINTMQVLLRRRRTEIAMLKTTGYQQRDLYALFGLEAGCIGLLGGSVGALAGIGVSFLVKGTVERAFFLTLPVVIDPVTVASGVAIGFFTALIFGLLPIVQASSVRPVAVLRDVSEVTDGQSLVVSIVLSILLAGLFFLLAWSILGNLFVSVFAVGGAGFFLLILSLFFTLVVVLISRLPVLESFRWWYLILVAAGILVSVGLLQLSTGFGVLFLIVSLFGVAVVLLPRTWKSNVKMALRNIGRQKVRTVTTLVALYIGVFSIGLILVLGQNIKDEINSFLSSTQTYNSFIVASSTDKPALDQALSQSRQLQGVKRIANAVARDIPIAVNGVPLKQVLQGAPARGSATRTGRNGAIFMLSGVQGYDVAHNTVPDVTIAKTQTGQQPGRNLLASDAGTTNALLPVSVIVPPLNLHVGDTVTVGVTDPTGKASTTATVHIVGFYNPTLTTFAPIYADVGVVNTLTHEKPLYVYSLVLNPKTADSTLSRIQNQVPGIQTLSFVNLSQLVNSFLNNVIVMLEAVASLAMLAGIIIIANAVALAMLERRRELGILKAVGHTSRSVLSEVLIENGVVGFTGGLLAMLLVTLATALLSKLVFDTAFGVSVPIVLIIVFASAAVAMIVAASVAWNATRVRPLEVLRYE